MASADVVVELRRVAHGRSWLLVVLLATLFGVIAVAVGLVLGGSVGGEALPLHRIVVTDRRSHEVLIEFDPPVLAGKQVLRLMRDQAERLDQEDFLRRWSSERSRRDELLAAGIRHR